MRLPDRHSSRLVSLPVLSVFLALSVNASAQFQNPIQAMKDAIRKAKQEQTRPQTATPAGISPQTATAETIGFDAPATAGTFGKIEDYKKMPDIIGIHLGMPLQDARAVLQSQYPTGRLENSLTDVLPGMPKVVYDVLLNFDHGWGAGPYNPTDIAAVDFTLPPAGPQVVYQMRRMVGFSQGVNHDTLIASLRKKYGKEALAWAGSERTTDDRKVTDLYWVFDEAGHPTRMPASDDAVFECGAHGGAMHDGSSSANWWQPVLQGDQHAELDQLTPWCLSSGVVLHIWDLGGTILNSFSSFMIDVPLLNRTTETSAAWYRDQVNKARQEQIEKSKQVQPSL